MIPIEQVYPDEAKEASERGYIYGPSDYGPLLQSFEYGILVRIDEDGYRGDSILLYKDGSERYGILVFGWGSCSGCDALQACHSMKEIEELRQQLFNQIQWFSRIEAVSYLLNHDWEGDYTDRQLTKKFVEESLVVLDKE